MIALLATAALAQDPTVTLGLDLGHQFTNQPDYDLFQGNALMLGLGARAQVAVIDRIQVVGTWQRSQRGGTLDVPEIGDPSSDFPEIRTVLTVDQFGLGPRADIEVNEMFYPYVMAQGMVWRGLVRLDDDPDTSTNPNQLRATGVTGGVLAMAGFEIRVPDHWFSAYAEFGHRWIGRASIDNLGTIRPRGYIQRLGVAIRL
ncbi:MAG: hypothetical protein AAF602_20870 [Myxococcota bacterium]